MGREEKKDKEETSTHRKFIEEGTKTKNDASQND